MPRGLRPFGAAIDDLGEVVTVAPMRVQSATGHAATFHRPIAVEKRDDTTWAIDGRPADCVKLGLHALFKNTTDKPFDLVISGMNAGANIGVNVFYSGTVGAAREANLSGIPAIAVSLHLKTWNFDNVQWHRAAAHARTAIDRCLAGPLDARTLINLNIPILDDGAEPAPGIAVVPASLSPMGIAYDRDVDDTGRTTYQRVSTMTFCAPEPGTDVDLLFKRHITLTPLHFNTSCPIATAQWQHVMAQSRARR